MVNLCLLILVIILIITLWRANVKLYGYLDDWNDKYAIIQNEKTGNSLIQMKEIMYMNFKKSITHLIKNQFLLLIFSFIEFTIVFIHILNTSIFIISFTSNISPYDNSIETISPYHYFRKLYSNSLSYKISIASVSILILIICGFFSLIAQINSEVLNAIFVNLYDILITRTYRNICHVAYRVKHVVCIDRFVFICL